MNSKKTETAANGSATATGVTGAPEQGKAEPKQVKAVKTAAGTSKVKGKAPAKAAKGKQGKAPAKGKSVQKGKAVKATAAKSENADGSAYRPNSSYGKLFLLLLKNKDKGINRQEFIKQGSKLIGKDLKHTAYDVAVVASPKSPKEGGGSHPSANRAADKYYVEKTEGGLLKLHLR
jgi:hypothetical protein